MKIEEDLLYTPKEVQAYLKVSPSTMTRMLRKGLILAARVGKQYRIRGAEILIFLNPKLAVKLRREYRKAREWVHEDDPVVHHG
ncbi:MAG: helix-turn-helix domain-containing protein [Candidatus Omnitrophota bacterium]